MGQYQYILFWYWPFVSVTSSRSWAEIISKGYSDAGTEAWSDSPGCRVRSQLSPQAEMSAVKETTWTCRSVRTCRNFYIGLWETWWRSYTAPSDCILTSAGVTPADISVCSQSQKKTIFLAGSQGISSCVCVWNKHFYFLKRDLWTIPAKKRYFRPTGAWALCGEQRNWD